MKIQGLYAIEISGQCNLSCSYCPYSQQRRERGLMDMATLRQTMSWLDEGMMHNLPIHLHLFGEPLMHPEFVTMARWIESHYPDVPLSFSTNATLLTSPWANKLAMVDWAWITLSPHDPRAVAKALVSLQSRGIKVKQQEGPDHNWAGQVDHPADWKMPCEFGGLGKVVVRWNGDVVLCCISDGPEGVIGTVWDEDLMDQEHRAFELCQHCHLDYGGTDANERCVVGDVVGMRSLSPRQVTVGL
jgi:sulfatase maturation enzyme AslB (radical SAM superfamily)